MDEVVAGEYPQGPARVPEALRRPPPTYRVRAWLAGLALLGFVGAYVALTAWLGWTSYRLIVAAVVRPHHNGGEIAGALLCAAMAFYLIASLFAVRRPAPPSGLAITAADHPRLFGFLRRIADEVGARMPDRVFLTAGCGAAVTFEISLANLIVRPRRHLVLGMGFVNLLSRNELKAVLAHELGHLCQRTSLIGRWSYVAELIAARLVARRSRIDRALVELLGAGHYVPILLGCVLLPIAWSLRAILDTLYVAVVRVDRAFVREGELQADLTAVTVAGSDAIVHALHREPAAQLSLERAIELAELEGLLGRPVADLFALQRRFVDHLRVVLQEPSFGRAPPLPPDAAAHRVFDPDFAHPPRTWDTHPPEDEREANAKRHYLAVADDDRDPWLLFEDPARVRAALTAQALERAAEVTPAPLATTIARVDRAMLRRHLQPRYRGAYLGRLTTRAQREVTALYGPEPAAPSLAAAIDALYPDALRAQLDRARALADDLARLRLLQNGVFEAAGRVIRYRGVDRRRAELPALIAAVERERDDARHVLDEHDARARAAHLAVARRRGPTWEAYLRSLLALVHYAEHGLATVTAGLHAVQMTKLRAAIIGSIHERGASPLVGATTALWRELAILQHGVAAIALPDAVASGITRAPWAAAFALPWHAPPDVVQLLVQGEYWGGRFATALHELRDAALDELLAAEDRCATWLRAGAAAIDPAPAPARLPPAYSIHLAGQVPPPMPKLDAWTRLRIADGPVAIAARFVASVALIGGLAFATTLIDGTRVVIYDGLGRDVEVTIGGQTIVVPAHGHRTIDVEPGPLRVVARTTDGRTIEAFDARCDEFRTCVYNVAAATPLIEERQTYTSRVVRNDREADVMLRAERWWATGADYVFAEPPQTLTRSSSETDDVHRVHLRAQHTADPEQLALGDAATAAAASAVHARWEPTTQRYFGVWWGASGDAAMLDARLAEEPDDLWLRRLEQDRGDPICRDHVAHAATRPEDPGWQYLAARCGGEPDRWRTLYQRWPAHPWLAYAYGAALAAHEDYAAANPIMTGACVASPALCEGVVLDIVRVRRATAGDGAPVLTGLPVDGWVSVLVAPEPGSVNHALAAGRLAEALGSEDLFHEQVTALVGASDGPPPGAVAMAAVMEPFDHPASLFAWAVARRVGGAADDERLRAAVEATVEPHAVPPVLAFLRAIDRDGALDVAAVEAEVVGLDVRSRGYALTAAAVRLGDRCPPSWRARAKQLLLPGERPYLR